MGKGENERNFSDISYQSSKLMDITLAWSKYYFMAMIAEKVR
jgi:hypothetical protein